MPWFNPRPGPWVHCFIQGRALCTTARRVCVLGWIALRIAPLAYCQPRIAPLRYCRLGLPTTGCSSSSACAYYSTKLQEHLTWQVRSSGGLLALQRSPPNPCNSGNLRPHKQNKSSLLLKWSRSRQLQGSIKFSHTEYIQAFIPTHFEY